MKTAVILFATVLTIQSLLWFALDHRAHSVADSHPSHPAPKSIMPLPPAEKRPVPSDRDVVARPTKVQQTSNALDLYSAELLSNPDYAELVFELMRLAARRSRIAILLRPVVSDAVVLDKYLDIVARRGFEKLCVEKVAEHDGSLQGQNGKANLEDRCMKIDTEASSQMSDLVGPEIFSKIQIVAHGLASFDIVNYLESRLIYSDAPLMSEQLTHLLPELTLEIAAMDDPYDIGDEIPDNLLAASKGFLTDPQFKGTLNNHSLKNREEMKGCRIMSAAGKPTGSGLGLGVFSLAVSLLGGFSSLCAATLGRERGPTG
jgi:hypothetical protein